MRQKGPPAGEAGNIALIPLIIVLLLVAGVAYFLITSGKLSNPLSKNTATIDVGAKIYQQNKNPVSGLPQTNPFSKVNPFKGAYKNPFQ